MSVDEGHELTNALYYFHSLDEAICETGLEKLLYRIISINDLKKVKYLLFTSIDSRSYGSSSFSETGESTSIDSGCSSSSSIVCESSPLARTSTIRSACSELHVIGWNFKVAYTRVIATIGLISHFAFKNMWALKERCCIIVMR